MRYEKIKEVESLLDLAFVLCALTALMFRVYWLVIVAVILVIADCVALAYMIYTYQKENKSIITTLKEHWFNIIWLAFECFLFCVLYINTSQV